MYSDKSLNKIKNKKTRKKTKAFTLIELLAVIIILGILMIIAIPSITNYISDSRDQAYIDTAKELMNSTRNLINGGNLKTYDTNASYYIPTTCLDSENGIKSPYGDFAPAYIVVTYNGKGFNYYWTSTDTSEKGIKDLVAYDDLSIDNIESGIKSTDIKDNVAAENKDKIIVFNANCTASEEKVAFKPERIREGTLTTDSSLGTSLDKLSFESIYTVNHLNVPDNAVKSWDVSKERNGSVMAWYVDNDNNGKYELYLGQKDGVIAGNYTQSLFAGYKNVSYIDLSYFDTSETTNMSHMFLQTGYDADTFEIKGLNQLKTSKVTTMYGMFNGTGRNARSVKFDVSNFDTSNVTSMTIMFYECGYSASELFSIGNLSNWDVSNVTDMWSMFYLCGREASTFDLGDLRRWDVSKVTRTTYMFASAGSNATHVYVGDLSNWKLSSDTDASYMFYFFGNKDKNFNMGTLANWDTSSISNMDSMFLGCGLEATTFRLDLSRWNVSNVTKMENMFYLAGRRSTTWSVGDLSNWDTANVTNMKGMFSDAGGNATWTSIGTLKIHNASVDSMFRNSNSAKATLNFYNNVSSYANMFYDASIKNNGSITVNYANGVNVDDMIATKSDRSNVVKGTQVQ